MKGKLSMPVILGLDVGDRRVGTAVADLSVGHAAPHQTFSRRGGLAEREIIKLIRERAVSTVIVGMPLDEHGRENFQCKSVRRFCRRLEKRLPVTIVYADEYLSSLAAKQYLNASAARERRLRRQGIIDALSASIILQTYLDSQSALTAG